MKHSMLHKLCAAASVSAMVFAFMPCAVMAADDDPIVQAAPVPTTGTVTMNNAVPGGKYEIFQLFTGTFENPDSSLLGQAVVNPDLEQILVNAIKTINPSFSVNTSASAAAQANQIAEAISNIGQNGANAQVNAQLLANKIAEGIASATPSPAGLSTQTATSGGVVTFSDLPTGYYLIKSVQSDGAYDQGKGAFTRAILLPVQQDKTITAKTTDVNNLQKFADRNGDKKYSEVRIEDGKVLCDQYKITAQVSNLYQYTKYPISIIDKLPTGLTTSADEVTNDWKVTINATLGDGQGAETKAITASLPATVSADGQTITWSGDLLAALKAAGFTDDQINAFDSVFTLTVTYTPVYTSEDIDALFNKLSTLSDPEVNSASITFPKNPYDGGTTGETYTAKTPESTVNTYSFNCVVKKLGQNGQPLTGAKFTLTSNGTTVGKDITAADDGTFTFTGLSEGVTYTLTETQVPSGMQQIDPISFTITAQLNGVNPPTAIVSIAGNKISDANNAAQITVNDATINVAVTNVPGHFLPETGMAGMTFMTGAGVVLAGSLYYLVRRKKSKED